MTEPGIEKSSAGALIKAAREKQGLHIAALAAAIKVAPRKLDALENDRWDELPDATFTRALAQTVCRTLKIDARPVLVLLPRAGAMALESGIGGLNMPFEGRPGREVPGGLAKAAIRPMVLAAGALMVAAALLVVLPAGWWLPDAGVPAGVAPPASAVAASAPPADAAAPAAEADFAASAPAPAVGETVFSAPPPEAADTAAAAAAAGTVQLRTSEDSWIDVRDASGRVLLSRTVLPGESVGPDGALPIRLVIGNAAATQLVFRGQAVDLLARTRDNVARIELP